MNFITVLVNLAVQLARLQPAGLNSMSGIFSLLLSGLACRLRRGCKLAEGFIMQQHLVLLALMQTMLLSTVKNLGLVRLQHELQPLYFYAIYSWRQ
jgi:hypothetical protein